MNQRLYGLKSITHKETFGEMLELWQGNHVKIYRMTRRTQTLSHPTPLPALECQQVGLQARTHPNTASAKRQENSAPEEPKHPRGKTSSSDIQHPNEMTEREMHQMTSSVIEHRAPTQLFKFLFFNTKRKLRITERQGKLPT